MDARRLVATEEESRHSRGTFSFVGRPDGLGNRLEEIIKLEAICCRENLECEYLWTNRLQHRTYDVSFRARNVKVTQREQPSNPPRRLSDFGPCTQAQILAAARSITPAFQVGFDSGVRPVGVHIRGSDRIGQDHPHFMRDEAELYGYLSGAADLINRTRPKYLYVCADDPAYRRTFLRHLDRGIQIVDPHRDRKVRPEYIEFFALALCERICMTSRFSSFAITASLIANAPLVAFIRDEAVRERYQARFEYHLDFDRNTVRPGGLLRRAGERLRRPLSRWFARD